MNKLILSGEVVKDPEAKEVGEKKTLLLSFPFAFKSGTGEYEKTHRIICKIWGKRGEYLRDDLSEGDFLVLEGQLQEERWKNKEGEWQSMWVITPEQIQTTRRRETQATL